MIFISLQSSLLLVLLQLTLSHCQIPQNHEERLLNNIFNHTAKAIRHQHNHETLFNEKNTSLLSPEHINGVDDEPATSSIGRMNGVSVLLSQQLRHRTLRTGGNERRKKNEEEEVEESNNEQEEGTPFFIGEDFLHRIFNMAILSMSTEAPVAAPVVVPPTIPIVVTPITPSSLIPVVAPAIPPMMSPIVGSPVIVPVTIAPTLGPVQLTVCDPPITLIKREEMILSILNDITPESVMLSIGTSQNKALDWIINIDEAKLCPDRVMDIQQRYIMAVNYYSLGGDDWYNCNALSSTDMDVLGPCPPTQQRHLSKANVCDWYSISCSIDGNITAIVLDDNNLVGLLPRELDSLEKLVNISFYNNTMISGSIPSTYGSLPRLQELDISNNIIVGTIPNSLCSGTTLRQLNFQMNELAGTLPTCIGTLVSLRTLRLDRNLLTGTIPSHITRLSSLEILSISNNELTGTIPSGIATNMALREISLQQNNLIGSIPTNIGVLTKLETINFIFNQLTGTIPLQLANLPNIKNIYLHFNNLTGTMPDSICALRDNKNGTIKQLTSDCGIRGTVVCPLDCCTACF